MISPQDVLATGQCQFRMFGYSNNDTHIWCLTWWHDQDLL